MSVDLNRRILPRKPVSSATEKWEQSALNEAESTNGPVSESRMGLVFMVGRRYKVVWLCVVSNNKAGQGCFAVDVDTEGAFSTETAGVKRSMTC